MSGTVTAGHQLASEDGRWRLVEAEQTCRLVMAGKDRPLWEVPGNCWQLILQQGRPHALVARVESFSFGANVKLLLVDPGGAESLLYDATVALVYGKALGSFANKGVRLSAITPQGDILVYA